MDKGAIPVLEKGQGVVPIEIERRQTGKLMLEGALKDRLGESVRVRLRPRQGKARIRARIGRDAPPGEYQVRLVADGVEMPVRLNIPERARLRIKPGSVQVSGAVGTTVSAKVTVINSGNTPMQVPKGGVAGLFASDGLASAFSTAYESAAEDPNEVFGAFINRLRHSYLGLMRLAFSTDEKGPLLPGESRIVTARFTIPQPKTPTVPIGKGRKFHATFVLECCRLKARLTLAPAASSKKRKASK